MENLTFYIRNGFATPPFVIQDLNARLARSTRGGNFTLEPSPANQFKLFNFIDPAGVWFDSKWEHTPQDSNFRSGIAEGWLSGWPMDSVRSSKLFERLTMVSQSVSFWHELWITIYEVCDLLLFTAPQNRARKSLGNFQVVLDLELTLKLPLHTTCGGKYLLQNLEREFFSILLWQPFYIEIGTPECWNNRRRRQRNVFRLASGRAGGKRIGS